MIFQGGGSGQDPLSPPLDPPMKINIGMQQVNKIKIGEDCSRCTYKYSRCEGLIFYLYFSAFSWFSAFEYMIAYANIGYHLTGLYDFKGKSLLGANLLDSSSNGTATRHIRNGRRKAE